MKKYSFFFHYNKPASKAANKNILSVHYKGQCHLVSDIECHVPVKTKARKRQPFCVLVGKGTLEIKNGVAILK